MHGWLFSAETLRLTLASLTGSVTCKTDDNLLRSQSAVLNIVVHVSHQILTIMIYETLNTVNIYKDPVVGLMPYTY